MSESLAAALGAAGITFVLAMIIGGLLMLAPVLVGISLAIAFVVGLFVYALDRLTDKPSE